MLHLSNVYRRCPLPTLHQTNQLHSILCVKTDVIVCALYNLQKRQMFSCAAVMKKTLSERAQSRSVQWNWVEGHSAWNKTVVIFSDLNVKLEHITKWIEQPSALLVPTSEHSTGTYTKDEPQPVFSGKVMDLHRCNLDLTLADNNESMVSHKTAPYM